MIKPFSENIVFMDAEFSSLDPYQGEILSVGLVKFNGKELYLELEYDGIVDKWVKKNVLPFLKEKKVNRETAKKKIVKFLGKLKPYMISYVNPYDAIYWYKLFGVENSPCHWIPIDFASLLFFTRINPTVLSEKRKSFLKKLGINSSKYRWHHALDDARLLKETYIRFLQKK